MAPAATVLPLRAVQTLAFIVVSCKALAPPLRPHSARNHLSSAVLRWHGELSHVTAPRSTGSRQHRRLRPSSLAERRVKDARVQHRRVASVRRETGRRAGSKKKTMSSEFEGSRQNVVDTGKNEESRSSSKAQAFVEHRAWQLGHLKSWLTSRVCMKKCSISIKAWEHISNTCKSECLNGLENLVQASNAIRPGEEHQIQFPRASSSTMHLHPANDNTEYNGMMFAGGVKVHGKTTFVARLCTHQCHVGDPFYDSTVILGELEQPRLSGQAGHPGGSWQWKHAAEHWVPHHDGEMQKGDYVGPEDPRMDVLRDSRFLTVGMNVPSKESGCGDSKIGIHRMFFVPVDNQAVLKTCDIRVPGVDKCAVQKNWASLVPRGSDDVYYIYSVRPLQVIRLQPKSCKTAWVETPDMQVQRPLRFDSKYAVHGGTRYVFGGQVADGDLFWSVGHTPSPEYMPVLIALLMRNATAARANPHFELVGVSCPIDISKKFSDPKSSSDDTWTDFMLITTSIVDFDPEADVSTITFQVHDRENYQSQLLGVGAWLQTAYKESRHGNIFSCDGLH